MQISFTYLELSKIFNKYIADAEESDDVQFSFIPIDNGVKIKFYRLKWKIFNFKKSVLAEIRRFKDGELEIKLEISGFLINLLKKLFMDMIFRFLKRSMKDEEVNFTDYVQVSKSKIFIQVNDLLKLMEVPVFVNDLQSSNDKLELQVSIG
ncbi:MAG: hypothetical protein ACOC10_08385 [Bacteroidota bacterium]